RVVFPVVPLLYVPYNMARYLADDLVRAGIPRITAAGKVDFHALRTTFTNLVFAQGATPPEAQALARHRSPAMTIGVYGRAHAPRLQALVAGVAAAIFPETTRAPDVHARVVGEALMQEHGGEMWHSAQLIKPSSMARSPWPGLPLISLPIPICATFAEPCLTSPQPVAMIRASTPTSTFPAPVWCGNC